MMRTAAATIAFCLALPVAVQAQDTIKRGADIAANGVGDTVPACAGCHAQNGIADGSGAFPRLAGQSAWYMARQFADYASGTRNSALMGPIAKALSPADGAAVAAYYASADGPFVFNKRADAALVERGRQLARIGDQAKALPACNNCHGPGGTGEFPGDPLPRRPVCRLHGAAAADVAVGLAQGQRRRHGGHRQAPRRPGHGGGGGLLPAASRSARPSDEEVTV